MIFEYFTLKIGNNNFEVTVHCLIQNILVLGKLKKNFAITPQSAGKYYYFGAFKNVLSKIMKGGPHYYFIFSK